MGKTENQAHDFNSPATLLLQKKSAALLSLWHSLNETSDVTVPALSANHSPVAMDTPGWAAATAFHITQEEEEPTSVSVCACVRACIHVHAGCQRYRNTQSNDTLRGRERKKLQPHRVFISEAVLQFIAFQYLEQRGG